MFCEDFDKFSEVYTMKGGRRGNGAICFLTSRNAKLRAQLETARAKIKDLEQQLLNKDIRIARLTKGGKTGSHLYGCTGSSRAGDRRPQHHGTLLP